MKVLIACEYSGRVRDAFIARGHDAISCDLLPSESPGPHHQGDVRPLLKQPWDLVIAHPSCQYLTNAGIRWLYQGGKKINGKNPKRWEAMREAAKFYAECWGANAPRVCIENSIMHPYAETELTHLGVPIEKAYSVQPWEFADRESHPDNVTKAAFLLTRGLPKLEGKGVLDGSTARPECHYASPGPDRWKVRSRTRQVIADAMADTWAND